MSERPLLTADPKAGFLAHAEEIRAAIERVLMSGHYILGPEGEAFEREFAAYQGGGQTISVANGTDALEVALRALGVVAGEKVATVANTVTATISAIQQIGAQPVYVEINSSDCLMSAAALSAVLARSPDIKVVIPVHLYGRMADMPAIMAVAEQHGARVLEDCAQAHGAEINQRKAGTWGHAAAFSFYPTKNLGALGDAGAIFTNEAALGDRARLLRQYGWSKRYVSEIPGRNSRLDEMQAAVLRVKLKYLDEENRQRRHLAAHYTSRLSGSGLTLPPEDTFSVSSCWHQYAIRLPRRDALREALVARGIHAGILYPVPLYKQPAYAQGVKLPVSEQACDEVLCLPIHPGITRDDVDRICDEIMKYFRP